MYLDGITGGTVTGTTLGSGQTLTKDVYILGAASTLNGELILDAEGDPDAIFIFQIDGAFTTTVGSTVTLINGASLCNVYWQVNGEVSLGEGSFFQGTIIANGAIHILEEASLSGRALACAGAIDLHNNTIGNGLPVRSTITANGATTFCAGSSVTLSGNIDGVWNTGEDTESIIVTTSGDFFVTNTAECGDVNSNTITVTVNPLPDCAITGDDNICEGGSTELCAPAGAATYLWSTGEATSCITVSEAGPYSVTITDADGCSSTCSVMVTDNPVGTCTITGDDNICEGGSTELCAPAGAATYLWSTGESASCITVSEAGPYSVTITDADGCSSTCSVMVTDNPVGTCTITGDDTICEGGSTELCAPAGAASYLWSTGEATSCITVSEAGPYSVTITDADGCSSTCSVTVTDNPVGTCTITGDDTICEGESTELCAPAGAATYLWSTGESASCITVSEAGPYSVTITDADGCSSTCSVTVTENPLPDCAITGDDNICDGGSTELCAPAGAATYLWSTGEATSCITVSEAGPYSVTITDADGCSSTCSVTVTDNPVGTCTITGDDTICDGGSTELCAPAGAASYLWSTGESASCITVSEAGPYSVTVTDADGCSSTCSVTVTENPLPDCAITGDDTICEGESTELCAPAGAATYLWSTGEATSCITVSEAGHYSVTITDADGCSSTCSVTVTIEENEPPVITCPADVDIECSQSTLPSATGFATATDECDVPPMVSFEDRVKEGGCPQEYLITRTWTATDESGKTTRCIQLINVHDTTPPVLTCPTDETIECRETPLFGMASAVDECGAPVEITFVTDSIPGDCDNEYTLIRTWTATDECWNAASCSSTIVVKDNTLPTLTCPAAIGPVECTDQIPAVDISLVTASDNCGTPTVIHLGDDISNQSCEDQFILTRTYQATDDCGNTATCTQEITVFDDTPPTLTFTNPLFTNGDTIQVQCYGQDPTWDLPEFNEGSVTAIDDCGGDITITFDRELLAGDCTEDGYINFHHLTWTATDACGNSESLLLFFALVDNTPPVIQGVPEDITVNCGEIPEAPFVYATDECLCACVVLFEETVPTSDCQDGQIIVRTWTANDDCGNVTTETQIITLVDNEAPVLIGVPDVTCIGAPELNSVSAIDNCAIPSIQFTEVEIPNPCGSGMVVQRIYEASDDCGNTSRDTVILLPNNQNQPSIELVNPILLDLAPGEIPVVNCSGQYTTSFGINDVKVEDICMNGGTVFFNETLLETSDCTDGGVVAIMEVKWIVVDACGNLGERTMIVHLIDETSPVFVNFDSEVSIGCENELPSILASDNCGEAFITTQDSIIPGDCASRYDIRTPGLGNGSLRQYHDPRTNRSCRRNRPGYYRLRSRNL